MKSVSSLGRITLEVLLDPLMKYVLIKFLPVFCIIKAQYICTFLDFSYKIVNFEGVRSELFMNRFEWSTYIFEWFFEVKSIIPLIYSIFFIIDATKKKEEEIELRYLHKS